MDAAVFRSLAELAHRRAGIVLNESREGYISARVDKRVRALGLRDAPEYLRLLESDRSGEEFERLLESLSSSTPRFYRDHQQFEQLTEAVRRWYEAGQRRFRLWSAVAGTGEEPYSVTIAVLEALAGKDADVRVLATDLSSRNLRIASEGTYEETSVAGLAQDVRKRWLARVGGRRSGDVETLYRVSPELRDRIVFKRLNLSTPPFPMRGPVDAVFCRDVMVYLEGPTRQRVAEEFDRLLRPSGLLFVGPAESLSGLRCQLRPTAPSTYRREELAHPVSVGASA